MFPSVSFSDTKAYKQLSQHATSIKALHLRDLFAQESSRFAEFSLRFEDILVDFSKNRITSETRTLLLGLAEECGLKLLLKPCLADRLSTKRKIELYCILLCATQTKRALR